MSTTTAEQPKPKPFANAKPRDQWRHPVRKLRRLEEVCVGQKKGADVFKLYWFTLTKNGLEVRPKHGRLKNAKVWPFTVLANGANRTGQMELLK